MGQLLQNSNKQVLIKYESGKRRRISKDLISQLPDDVLISVLSLLTIEEAVATSILSRRWRYLWHLFAGNMDFYLMENSVNGKKVVNWVDHVLELNKALTFERFKVYFNDQCALSSDVERWVELATKRRLKRLELECTMQLFHFLPSHFLYRSNLNNLVVLKLINIDVYGEAIQYILMNCPSLQVLWANGSCCISKLIVTDPSLKLKHLELLDCCNMESLEISAENLTHFKYSGPMIKNLFKSVPSLVDLYLGGKQWSLIEEIAFGPQILKLSLDVSSLMVLYNIKHLKFPKNVEFGNLQELELIFVPSFWPTVEYCMALLDAAPLVRKLLLKFNSLGMEPSYKVHVEAVKNTLSLHRNIRVVEVSGFYGSDLDIYTMLHLINKFVSLERLSFYLHPLKYFQYNLSLMRKHIAKYQILKHLQPQLPLGAELTIVY